jgi:hypothetical protein
LLQQLLSKSPSRLGEEITTVEVGSDDDEEEEEEKKTEQRVAAAVATVSRIDGTRGSGSAPNQALSLALHTLVLLAGLYFIWGSPKSPFI